MKSLLILLPGCLPLAILTAMSFVELRAIDEASITRSSAGTQTDPTAVESARLQLKTDKPVIEGLGRANLLTSETLAGLEDIPADHHLTALKDSWEGWLNSRRLVSRSARIPAADAATGAGSPPELPQTQEALLAEYEKKKPEGSEAVRAILARRVESQRRQASQSAAQREADGLLAQARTEFATNRYAACTTLCDQWLAKYSQRDAAVSAKMRLLRERAQFLEAYRQMLTEVRQADSMARQQELVDAFLNRYAGRPSPTPREQAILEQSHGASAKLRARLQAEAVNRRAAESLRSLTEKPPAGLASRLQAAAQLGAEYPTEAVRESLRKQVRVWLAEALADKVIEEPAALLEAETCRGEVLRGFFRKSLAPDGSLLGYQHFTSYQQYRDPTAQVGTYAKADLAAEPGVSLPRQCLGRYRQLRDEMLSQPGRKSNWENLLAACEQSDVRLAAYRQKPGASAEAISFQTETRLVREILSAPVWGDMARLFGE